MIKMVFKLVRVDSVEPCKIPLPVGTYNLGRGKFLDCDDKKVSRNHGVLEVTNDTVTIKALHHNPCFYTRKGSENIEVLKQNCAADLSNGDKFGLLPDIYWYEILHCIALDVLTHSPDKMEESKEVETSGVPLETIPNDLKEDMHDGDSMPLDFDLNEAGENIDRSESPSLIPINNQENLTEEYRVDEQTSAEKNAEQTDEVKSPLKRNHSEEFENNDEIKKVKTEPEECVNNEDTEKVKTEPDDVNEPEDVQPGPSNDQLNSHKNDDNEKNKDANPASPVKPPNVGPLRERCMYGANCYRRNPQHKTQFSHPSDADWGTGDRGVCPWGRSCRRRDPRHWRDHQHPPDMQPPSPNVNRPGKERKRKPKKRDLSPEVSTDLIVTGKRARKTVRRPSYSGSESENEYDMNDPFLTDESDEWQPSSDTEIDTQDYSQDD